MKKNNCKSVSFEEFNKIFKKEKYFIYLITILFLIAFTYLLQTILYINTKNFPILLIFTLVSSLICIFVSRKHKNKVESGELYVDEKDKVEELFDKYSKRYLICLFIIFISIFDRIFNIINLGFNSRSNEIVEVIITAWSMLEIYLFFFIKNILITKWLNKKIAFENNNIFKKVLKNTLIFSCIYFVISLGLFYGFEKVFVLTISPGIIAIYDIYALIRYFTKSKEFSYNKKGINKLIFVPILIALLLIGGYSFLSRDIWLTQPYINKTPYIYEGNDKIEYNEETGVYTIISNEDDFKILQLTDIHLGGSMLSYDKDLKALKASFALIEHTKPDLVIVTGDLSYPVGLSSFSFNNTAPVSQFAAFMRNTGVPWAFTYGNHDVEDMAIGSNEDLNELYMSLSYKTSRNLLYPYIQPKVNDKEITGRNNQLIEIRNSDGSLNQALFLIDSNAYIGKGFSKYDYIRDEQVEWYKNEIERLNKEEGKIISSLGFFHIPLQEYKIAYDLYMKDSDEVTYYFGSNEEKNEKKVAASEYPSKLFDTALELGSTKGFFCGHDHYNNLSVEYKGIRLTYGMSIDYLVEPGIARDTKQRGATLITSHKDSSIDIKQIPLDSLN